MKSYTKKLLSVLVSAMLALGLMVPALASETGTPTTTTDPRIQITKVLNIGRGITIPGETFRFQFDTVTGSDAIISQLGDVTGYIDPGDGATGYTQYPAIPNATVNYATISRSSDSTDTEIVLPTDEINLNNITWPKPGLYIYSVKEVQPAAPTSGMTYDAQTYYLKVMVSTDEASSTCKVSSLAVMGYNDTVKEWVKINGAPDLSREESSVTDGCDDYKGNDFRFVNTYQKMVEKHPYNEQSPTDVNDNGFSEYAFKLEKSVSGTYASDTDGFGFFVYVTYPDTYDGESKTVKMQTTRYVAVKDFGLNGIPYSDETAGEPVEVAFEIVDNDLIPVHLRPGQSFSIESLPAGTIIHVTEEAFVGKPYSPSYKGKWGIDTNTLHSDESTKNTELKSGEILVGENGAYIHFTNTINDNDMTATGIVIDNLPYILMVGIALGGIGALTLSKKRRNG